MRFEDCNAVHMRLPLILVVAGAVAACEADDPPSTASSTDTTLPPPASPTVKLGMPAAAECFETAIVAESAAAVGITSDGRVVGNVLGLAPGDATHAFIWSDGESKNLPSLGGEATYALGMNARGDVVGVATRAGETSPSHAVLWTNGGITELGDFGSGWSTAAHVNDAGAVAGISSTSDNANYAFFWKDGALQRIGVRAADAINAKGQVLAHGADGAFLWKDGNLIALGAADFAALDPAGRVLLQREDHAYLWIDGTSTELIPFADETSVTFSAFNLGTATRADGTKSGFLWQSATIDLGSLTPIAVNIHNEVAGSVGLQAAVWKAGKTVLLSPATPNGAYAASINDAGQAAGVFDQTIMRWSTTGCF